MIKFGLWNYFLKWLVLLQPLLYMWPRRQKIGIWLQKVTRARHRFYQVNRQQCYQKHAYRVQTLTFLNQPKMCDSLALYFRRMTADHETASVFIYGKHRLKKRCGSCRDTQLATAIGTSAQKWIEAVGK